MYGLPFDRLRTGPSAELTEASGQALRQFSVMLSLSKHQGRLRTGWDDEEGGVQFHEKRLKERPSVDDQGPFRC